MEKKDKQVLWSLSSESFTGSNKYSQLSAMHGKVCSVSVDQ